MAKLLPERESPKVTMKPPEPRPSASVLLLSPENEVLLLHRVQTSRSFASAHVFPGGNLDSMHDGIIPEASNPDRHRDGPAYRMAAIRECFEECGILLARPKKTPLSTSSSTKLFHSGGGELVRLAPEVRDEKRKAVHSQSLTFPSLLEELDVVADVDALIPFTRWITPVGVKRRFTTQMYLYFLPLSSSALANTGALKTTEASVESIEAEHEAILPTPDGDGGIEHTAAQFASPGSWLRRAREGEISMMPPQVYLLHQLHTVVHGPFDGLPWDHPLPSNDYEGQRRRILEWLGRTPTFEGPGASGKPGSMVPWKDKVLSPMMLMRKQEDGRSILALDSPAREMGKQRVGDPDRVVIVRFKGGTAWQVEIRPREVVMREERENNKDQDKKSKI